MSASLSNAISVILNQGGSVAQADNQNVICFVTTNDAIGLSENNRAESFTDLNSIGVAYGTSSAEYLYAQSALSTSPNSVNAGGRIVFGYRSAGTVLPGAAGYIEGAQIDEASTLSTLQSISDGYFAYTEDGVTYGISGLDFTGVSDIFLAFALINGAVNASTGGSVVGINFGGGNVGVEIRTGTTGATATITTAFDDGALGTYIGDLLGISSGSGAVAFNGSGGGLTSPESVADALDAINETIRCKGFVFIDAPADDAEIAERAAYAEANQVLIYEVFSDPSNLETLVGNPVWDAKLAGHTYFRMLYSKSNNRRMAASYMARMHSINFNEQNSAITMQFKELSVTPDNYTQTEIDKAKAVGLDIYTTFKDNVPKLLTSGANDYTDNIYNLMSFVEEIKVDLFNVLGGTRTKVPQTVQGGNLLVDQAERTTQKYVNAGVFAPGTWNSTDTFGDLNTFNKNIELNGFYWKIGSFAAQSPAERQSRVSPVLMGAVKSAGAIHKADVIINFNA